MGDFYNKAETQPLLSNLNHSKKARDNWDILDRQPPPVQKARSIVRLQSVHNTVRTLQLDHTQSSSAIVSYIVAFVLLIVVPIFKLLFVKSNTDMPRRQLVFQPVVVAVGVSRSVVSFVFLSHAIRLHGLQGFLFLDSVAEEVAQVRKDYDTVIELGSKILYKLFFPSFVLYIAQLIWLYTEVELKPLPFFTHHYHYTELVLVVVTTTLSWMFQTTTYLYACVLFWKVCKLQELKMKQYYEILLQGVDAEYYVLEYDRIKEDLKQTSHRFRHFLAFTGVIGVSGALISLYEVIDSINDDFPLCIWGELLVLTVVNLTGAWVCLQCASAIAQLHRSIVKRASCIHAKQTLRFSTGQPMPKSSNLVPSSPSTKIPAASNKTPAPSAKAPENVGNQAMLEKIENYCQRQDAWARRAAIVEFLSSSEVGVSVYGIILDRFFVHTSVGALLTTTWFILGRSLQG